VTTAIAAACALVRLRFPHNPHRSYGSTTTRRKDRRADGATHKGRDEHFARLRDFFVKYNVMTPAGKWISGSNYKQLIHNVDGCPSPLDGGKSGGAPKTGYREKGTIRRCIDTGSRPTQTRRVAGRAIRNR